MAAGMPMSESDEDLQEGSAEDEADDAGAISAESHADADFAGAALDGVGGDAVEADGGEDEGEDAEEAGHVGDGTLLIEVGVDLLAHGQDIEEGEVGIDVGEDAADLGLEAFHAAAGLEDGAFDVVGHVIDAAHHRVVFVFDVLREGDEEHRARRLGVGGIVVLGVADDADDFIGAAVAGEIEAEVLADGVFAGLEEALDEGFVDDDDVLGGGGVVCGDGAAADDLLAEGFKVAWRYVIPGGADRVVHVWACRGPGG